MSDEQIKTGPDIVERLRRIALIHRGRKGHECIAEAADEIERLRALITAWVECCDDGRTDLEAMGRFSDSIDALREAVGR